MDDDARGRYRARAMEPEGPEPSDPSDPARMSTLEGVGSLLVIGGVLTWATIVANPHMAGTFLPLGAIAALAGIAIVWLARRIGRS